ncbi:hypothetical protein GCM10027174_41300 [Salinifilum aidingensis]
MTKFARSVLAVSASALLLGVSACATPAGGGGSEAPETSETQQSKALENFDPCTFFKPDELTSWSLPAQGEDSTQVSWEPTCRWSGDSKTLDLSKNVEETVDSYEQNSSWATYEKQPIGGRSGAVAVTSGASGGGGCNVLVDAGGGVVIYQITSDVDDACSELKPIAEATAGRLPQ